MTIAWTQFFFLSLPLSIRFICYFQIEQKTNPKPYAKRYIVRCRRCSSSFRTHSVICIYFILFSVVVCICSSPHTEWMGSIATEIDKIIIKQLIMQILPNKKPIKKNIRSILLMTRKWGSNHWAWDAFNRKMKWILFVWSACIRIQIVLNCAVAISTVGLERTFYPVRWCYLWSRAA